MEVLLSSQFTLNWESNSSPTVEGPGSFSLVSARFRISSISISCDQNRPEHMSVLRLQPRLRPNAVIQTSTYLRFLLLPLWLFEELLCAKLEDGRQFLLVKRC